MGLLDLDPQTMGLLAASAAMMEASGPSRLPVTFGQALGAGLNAGMGGYMQGQQFSLKKKLADQQAEQQAMQLQIMQAKIAEQNRQRAAVEALRGQIPEALRGVYDVSPDKVIGSMFKDPHPPQLVDVEGPDGRTVKKWLRPGESTGAVVGNAPSKAPEGMQYQHGQLVPIPGYLDMKKQIAAAGRMPTQPTPAQLIKTDDGYLWVDPRTRTTTPAIRPDGQPMRPPTTEKALPPSAAQKLMENQQNLRRATQALELIRGGSIGDAQGDKTATGWKGFAPDFILQRADPEGVATRAAIGDLGSLVIHDRSGAAVTAAEFPRLRPFIPTVTDDPATVEKKLSRFVSEYQTIVDETTDFYKGSGYKVPAETLRGGDGQPAMTDLQAAARAELERRRGRK